jgi:hypothetical protein
LISLVVKQQQQSEQQVQLAHQVARLEPQVLLAAQAQLASAQVEQLELLAQLEQAD